MVPEHVFAATATQAGLRHRYVLRTGAASMLSHAWRMAMVCFLTIGIAGPAHAFEWECAVTVLWVTQYRTQVGSEAACRSEVETANSQILGGSSVIATPLSCKYYPLSHFTLCGVLYYFPGGSPGVLGAAGYRVPSHNIIKLSPANSSVEPGKTVNLLARVFDDQNNQPVPNVGVIIEVTVGENSGGHMHDVNRPKGIVSPSAGSTGPDGSGLALSFTAPVSAGDHTITARCADDSCGEATASVWVGIQGLVPLYETHLYKLVGSDDAHPDNHYLTIAATGSVVWLAELYRARFPNDPPLHLNDASLERGGLFDIKYPARAQWWTPPHVEHQRGTVIDVRANDAPGAIPAGQHEAFVEITDQIRADAELHSPGTANQHFHVRLKGVAE